MDQEMIQYISEFLSKFYIWEILIIILVILLTTFIKIPIKKKALKLQEKYGVDKAMLTWVTALIPYVLCLSMVFVLFWYKSGWSEYLDQLDYSGIISEGLVLGSGAIGLYEAVKKIIKGSKAIKEKKELQRAVDLKAVAAEKRLAKSPYRTKEEK